MKILYLVNMNENNIKGLFTANHEKIKALYNIKNDDDDLNIYSVQFYDVGISKIIKKLRKKKIFINNGPSFSLEGIVYRKEYLKVGLFSRFIEKQDDDYNKYKPFIEKHLKEIKACDLVVAQWGYPHGRLAYHINKKFNKPYFVQYYGSEIHTNPFKNENVKKKTVDVLNNAANNFFVSDKLRMTANELGWNKENYSLTKNGVNFEKFYDIGEDKINKLKEELDIKEVKVIGYVGSLTEVKRSDKIVDIFSKVNEKCKCKFLLVGDGDMRSLVEKEAIDRNLEVIFTGNVDIESVNKYMSLMDIMILPSRREGFGSVIVEANSKGILVIGSDAGGIPEVIGDEDLIVKEGDDFEQRYANRILKYLSSGWDKEKLIKKSHDNFDWESIAKNDLDKIRGVFENERQ